MHVSILIVMLQICQVLWITQSSKIDTENPHLALLYINNKVRNSYRRLR